MQDDKLIRSELLAFQPNINRPENAVVLAREWPSWLFVLPGMGFEKIHVFIHTLLKDEVEEALRAQFTFHDIMNTDDDIKFIPNPVFFLAGSEEYLVRRVQELDSTKPMWLAVEGHPRQHPRVGANFHWAEIRHAVVGGVTGCQSWVGQNKFEWWEHPPELDPNHRWLRDVLSPTKLGKVLVAPN